MAGAPVVGGGLFELRALLAADGQGPGAAGVEAAAGGGIGRAGQVAGELDLVAAHGFARHLGDGGEQGLGVGVLGVAVQVLLVGQLHHVAQVHDPDPVGDVLDHGQVVGDKDVAQAHGFLHGFEQVDDLGLDRHVQGGDRLVADDQLGGQDNGPGDADALALAAGKLVGVAVHVVQVQAGHLHYLADPVVPLGLGLVGVVDIDVLPDDVLDGHAGVEGGEGVLEDQLHLPAGLVELRPGQGGKILPVQEDLPGRGLDQAQDSLAHGALAAAGFADDADGLPVV